MDNLAQRFIMGISPVITVTKCHDLEYAEVLYDLYLNGKPDGKYNLVQLQKRFLEVMTEI